LLTPVAATAALPHDRNPNRDERAVDVNGRPTPLRCSLACHICRQPAVPIGLTGEGLPADLQIIGLEGEDFARLLAAEIGGFVPPPAYSVTVQLAASRSED
jgi:amidase